MPKLAAEILAFMSFPKDHRAKIHCAGQQAVIELSSEECEPLFVPIGFAHGFCTLEADTVVRYKVSAPYDREYDGGILWKFGRQNRVASRPRTGDPFKNKQLPRLRDLAALFSYTGT